MKGLFVGLNTIDLQFLIKDFPKSNTKIKALKYGMYAGGPATNAAIAFAHLGGKSILLTLIGNHYFADFVKQELTELKVEVIELASKSTILPPFATIWTNESNGDRSICSFHNEQQDISLNGFEMYNIQEYDIILLDGFYMNINSQIALAAKELNKTVVLDAGSWKKGIESLLLCVDIAICSADFYPPGCFTTDDVCDYLINKGLTHFAITRGSDSILAYEKGTTYKITIESIKAMDTLGAGDIFHGAFCYYFTKLRNFNNALDNASKVATESCKYFGTRNWLNKYSQNI